MRGRQQKSQRMNKRITACRRAMCEVTRQRAAWGGPFRVVSEGVSEEVTCQTPGPLHETPSLLFLSCSLSLPISLALFFFHSFSKYELRPYYIPGLEATADPALIRELSVHRGEQYLSKPVSTRLSGQTSRSSWTPPPPLPTSNPGARHIKSTPKSP